MNKLTKCILTSTTFPFIQVDNTHTITKLYQLFREPDVMLVYQLKKVTITIDIS